jgi:hypothetical protein
VCPAAYIGSVVATLYAAVIMHSYLLSLLCSGLQASRMTPDVKQADMV